jgi:hypothetical protein
MTSRAKPTSLLDGPRRSIALGVVMVVLTLITLDGVFTWLEATDAENTIDDVVAANPERYPTGIDDAGTLLNETDRAVVAANTNGDRLDSDLVATKTWLAAIALIAAVSLTIASGPGFSRNTMAASIVVAAGAFFVPLVFFTDTIDAVTTAHGG